jgi:large subunit ribosomal protein L29
MKAGEIRELTLEELKQKEQELRRKLLNLRFQRETGELDNTAELVKTRRDIARVMSVRREKTQRAEA